MRIRSTFFSIHLLINYINFYVLLCDVKFSTKRLGHYGHCCWHWKIPKNCVGGYTQKLLERLFFNAFVRFYYTQDREGHPVGDK